MNLGVYKNFTSEDEEEGLIDVLKNLESRQDVKEVKIKSANAKTVIYLITSDDRFITQNILNEGGIIIGKLNCDEFAMGSSNAVSYTHLTLPTKRIV